jgi:hypothetical protein
MKYGVNKYYNKEEDDSYCEKCNKSLSKIKKIWNK